MVREELHLDTTQLPEVKMQGVWRSLDADSSGFISAGEFGVFMRYGEKEIACEAALAHERAKEQLRKKLKKEEEVANRQAARRLADTTKRLEAEAARLKAELESKVTPTADSVRSRHVSVWDGSGYKQQPLQ